MKLPELEREDLHDLEDFVLRSPDGVAVPLMDVVTVTRTEHSRASTGVTGDAW